MDTVLLASRLLLAGILATAGAAKLADRAGTRQAILDFGLPRGTAASVAVGLPVLEVSIAVALVPSATARGGAIAALVLLLAILAAIVFNLARGRKPSCRCFGQIRPMPIGYRTIALNFVLILLAGLAVWNAAPGPLDWILAAGGDPAARAVALAALLMATGLAALAWHLRTERQRLLLRLGALESLPTRERAADLHGTEVEESDEGLPIGSAAPPFAVEAVDGGVVTLAQLLAAQRPLLLMFTDPQCGPCEEMLPMIARWQHRFRQVLTIAVLSEGSAAENRGKATELGLTQVLLQRRGEVADAYGCLGAPGAVLVHPDGTIGSRVAGGSREIERLVAAVAASAGAGSHPAMRGALHILGRQETLSAQQRPKEVT